jgi:glycosyltransferase involved in cell wall biosynthesis
MNPSPVSVVIPTYNRAELLSRALVSVAEQTLKCSEIIVVYDGSTDSTLDFLNELLCTTEMDLKVIKQSNKGPAAARNCGIKSSKNEYIAFLDSDDHWHKKKIEMQYKVFIENPEYMISHTKEKWLRRGVHLNQRKKHIPRHGDIFDHSLQLCSVGMSTVMVKKNLFQKVGLFDEILRCCEDYDFWLRISCRFPFYLVDVPLTVKEGGREDQISYIYRMGMDSIRVYAIKKIIDSKMLSENQCLLALDEFEKKCTVFGRGCLKHGKREAGEYYLNLAESYRQKHEKGYLRAEEKEKKSG